MTTINLLTKGDYTICYLQNKNGTNYVSFSDIKEYVYKLCGNYDEITITEKNIIISNPKLKLNINNYKDNTNVLMMPVIKKLQKEYRELKLKKLRNQKIKRVGAFSCALLISSGIIVNALSNNKKDYLYEDIKPNVIEDTYKEVEETPKVSFVIEEKKQTENNIFDENIKSFEINFESRVDSEKYRITKAYYSQMITNISNEYGIDPKIMLAIATQESGIHNPERKGAAMGLMQIELAVWNGKKISAYNYEKGVNETIVITEEKLKDLEFNIRSACMIFKDCLNKSNYNLPVAIQMYNFGYGNVKKIFKNCYDNNMKFEELCINCDNNWLENRDSIKEGDNKYLEHVLSYIENLDNIQIKKGDEILNYNFINNVKTL